MNLIELSEINVNIKLRSAAQPCYRLPAPARFESFRICRTTNASVYTAINPDTAGAIEPISSIPVTRLSTATFHYLPVTAPAKT